MFKTGLFFVDCGNLDLTSETEQTIDGIYDQVVAALASGKPIIAQNCKWGTAAFSPIHVFGGYVDGTIILTASTLQVIVADDDGVTIRNLIS